MLPKNLLTVQLKEKVTYIFDDLRVSKLTAHFHFWVNYPFKASENDLFAIKTRILKFLPIPIPDSLTPAAKSTQRQNNESALDSQQMLNLQEITHNHCSNSNVWNVQEFNIWNVPRIQTFGMFQKWNSCYNVSSRNWQNVWHFGNGPKNINVATSNLCCFPALTKIPEIN